MIGKNRTRAPLAACLTALLVALTVPSHDASLAQQAESAPAQAEAIPAEPMPAEPMPAEAMPAESLPEGAMEGGAAAPGTQEPMTETPEGAQGEVPTQAAPAPGAAPEMPAGAQADAEMPAQAPSGEGGEGATMQEEALEMAPPPEPPATPEPPVVERAPRGGDVLEIGTDYRGPAYRQATGLILSEAHGRRLVRTFVSPPAAAKMYRKNAAKVRQDVGTGLLPFPEGTIIVQESFSRLRNGAPGKPGPLFVMKKEAPGYDPSGNDWRYAFAQADLQLIGDGTGGSVASCKACHTGAKERDFVMASDR